MIRIFAAAWLHAAGRFLRHKLCLTATLWWCALLLAAPGSALAAGACSAYMGQAVINEVRVGRSDGTDAKNQVEIFNTSNISSTVWQTWSVVIWYQDGTKAAVKKGTYPMSTGHTASGQFIYNSATKYWLRNSDAKKVSIALIDGNGDFVDYFAVEGSEIGRASCRERVYSSV